MNLAFFPLYPLTVHLLLTIWPWVPILAAMLVSNLCALGSALLFYRIVAADFGPQVARRASWILAMFPTSLFFFAGYSEGAFLLFELLCFSFMQQKRWWWAGLCGALATATRPTGMVMLVPGAVCWYQAHRDDILAPRMGRSGFRPAGTTVKRAIGSLSAVAMLPGGIVAFMCYLGLRFGNPLAFATSQRSWHRTWAWPWRTIEEAIARPLAGFPSLSTDQMHGLLDTAFCIVFLSLSISSARRLLPSYRAYLWGFWLLALSTPALLDGVSDPLISLPRFLLTAFPLCVLLALTRRRLVVSLCLAVPLLAINTLIFVSGGWVA